MVVPKKNRPISSTLRSTHQILTPILDQENSRFLVHCSCPSHFGFIHPSVLNRGRDYSCDTSCTNFKKLRLPDREFDQQLLQEYLDRFYSCNRNHPTLKVKSIYHPERKTHFYWILDKGERLYVLRPEKSSLVPNFIEDHFQLFLT